MSNWPDPVGTARTGEWSAEGPRTIAFIGGDRRDRWTIQGGGQKTEKPPFRRLFVGCGRVVRRGPPSSSAAGSRPGRWSLRRVRWIGCVSFSCFARQSLGGGGVGDQLLLVVDGAKLLKRLQPDIPDRAVGGIWRTSGPFACRGGESTGRRHGTAGPENSEAFRGAGRLFAEREGSGITPRRGAPVR